MSDFTNVLLLEYKVQTC